MTVNTPILRDCNHSEEKEEIFDPIAPLSLATYEKLNRVAECELYRENLLPVKIAGSVKISTTPYVSSPLLN